MRCSDNSEKLSTEMAWHNHSELILNAGMTVTCKCVVRLCRRCRHVLAHAAMCAQCPGLVDIVNVFPPFVLNSTQKFKVFIFGNYFPLYIFPMNKGHSISLPFLQLLLTLFLFGMALIVTRASENNNKKVNFFQNQWCMDTVLLK